VSSAAAKMALGIAGVILCAVLQSIGLREALPRLLAVGPEFGATRSASFGPLFLLLLVGAMIAAQGLYSLLPPAARVSGGWTRLVLALFCLLFPVVGPVGMLFGLILPLRLPHRHRPTNPIQTMAEPSLPERAILASAEPNHGHGSLFGRLRNAGDASARLLAVMATRHISGRTAVPILKLALHDPADDVRLLAHAILDTRESAIYRRIRDHLAALDGAVPAAKPGLHLRLAEEYWDLAYQGLSAGEILQYVLTQAAEHLAYALVADPQNGGLWLLKGRIQLRQRAPENAFVSFERARLCGLPARVINPHMAEVAFARRRFSEVRIQLAALGVDSLRRPTVRQIAEYWR
jgi:polysaccharide biosynthesis protein PelE